MTGMGTPEIPPVVVDRWIAFFEAHGPHRLDVVPQDGLDRHTPDGTHHPLFCCLSRPSKASVAAPTLDAAPPAEGWLTASAFPAKGPILNPVSARPTPPSFCPQLAVRGLLLKPACESGLLRTA